MQVSPAQRTSGRQAAELMISRTVGTLLLGSTVAVMALTVVAPEQRARFAAPTLIAVIALFAWVALKLGRLQLAKYVLAFGVWLGTTLIAAFTGGVRAPVIIAYPVIILVTAWIVDSGLAFMIAGLTVASTVGLMALESYGIGVSYLPSSLAMYAGDQIVVYGLSYVLAGILLRAYRARLAALDTAHTALQKQAQVLKTAQTELEQAQSVALLGSWVYDPESGRMRLSHECCRILGMPPGQEISRDDYLNLVHPKDRAPVQEVMARVMDSGAVDHEHRIVVAGQLRWVRHKANPVRVAPDARVQIMGIVQDISERKHREAALQESEQRYRAAFQISPDAVSINRRADGVYVDVNDGFTRLTGWRRDEVIGKTPGELRIFRTADEYKRVIMALNAAGRCENLEADFMTQDGRTLNGQMSAQVMHIDGIACVLSVSRDLTSRKQAEQQINSLAFYDSLTQLPNRRLFLDRLRQAMGVSARHRQQGAVLFVDLDDFKTLNETMGHEQGDRMLQLVASSLLSCVREGDTVGRTGGDEFVILLEGLGEGVNDAVTQVEGVGRKVLASLNRTYDLQGAFIHGSASVGITLFGPEASEQPDEPVKRAELAMYQAKTAGGNTLRFFEPGMQASVSARADLAMGLREAIQKGHLVLHYQPQVADGGRVVGVEALVRWMHPERGLIPPADFIPLAEETGLIVPMGVWVLQTACEVLARWAKGGPCAHLDLAVNVSARQFNQPEFVEQLLSIIQRTGAPARHLKLELTESLLVNHVEDVIARMNLLKAAGVGFSLDDFGTGYSSLSYLKRLPLDQVKIDQGFVRNILDDANDASIARMVVALASSMGLGSVAEGVETEAQREFLAGLGCHCYQGYLFSRPVPIEDFEVYAQRANQQDAA